jgi:hypothetical protein
MKTKELQNSIIQKVWRTDDKQFLEYLNQLLTERAKNRNYELSEFEKSLISDNQANYLSEKMISN